jgi:type IV secretion system protein TrbG
MNAVMRAAKPNPEPEDPRKRVDLASAAARVEPSRNGYINAVQVYAHSAGALYQAYAAPGQVTDIALQEGEQLVGTRSLTKNWGSFGLASLLVESLRID